MCRSISPFWVYTPLRDAPCSRLVTPVREECICHVCTAAERLADNQHLLVHVFHNTEAVVPALQQSAFA